MVRLLDFFSRHFLAFLTSFQFLTIISFRKNLVVGDSELRHSIDYFPIVGILIGCFMSGIGWACSKVFPCSLVGAVLVLVLAILTRALHLDGLADTADGLGSGKEPEKALEIMKDSRTGAFGAVAVALVLLLKAQGFSALCQNDLWLGLALVPCLSRFGLNVLASFSVYARPAGGLGKYFVGEQIRVRLCFPFAVTVVFSWCFLGQAGVLFCLFVAFLGFIAAQYFKKRLGGVTGDVLGAHIEALEAIMPLVMVAYFKLSEIVAALSG